MLRDYQQQLITDIRAEWQKVRNVVAVLPTGAGKTYTFSSIVKDETTPTIVIAHRNELVGQMSLALASLGIYHRIIASDKSVSEIIKAHRQQLGKVYFDPTADVVCASVDTLIRRHDPKFFDNIGLWVIDEAHHVLKNNKWGEALAKFPNARGLGVTATPLRADGKGLGSHSDGVFDSLVVGPTGDDLIEMGYLSPYVVLGPEVDDLDLDSVEHGATGDFKQNQLRTATKKSKKLVGSVIEHYQRFAAGKLGITFCVDIESAEEMAAKYNAAGIPAAVVSSKTPFLQRVRILEDFKKGIYRQLVNVDLFGEGFDVPGVEVVVMTRRTDSFGLYSQQFGRALRPVYAPGYDLSTPENRRAAIAAGPKPHAIIIDHVGNVVHHLLPTPPKYWTLDSRERRGGGSALSQEDKLKFCKNPLCLQSYRAILHSCPHCGQAPTVDAAARTKPEEVDGDLELLDVDYLRKLQLEANRVVESNPRAPKNLSRPALLGLMKRHSERAKAQTELRETISQWAGYRVQDGLDVRMCQKLFYLRFNVDVLTAQTLSKKEAEELRGKIQNDFTNVVSALGN